MSAADVVEQENAIYAVAREPVRSASDGAECPTTPGVRVARAGLNAKAVMETADANIAAETVNVIFAAEAVNDKA